MISPFFRENIILAGPHFNTDENFICKLKTLEKNNPSIMLHYDGYCLRQEIFKSFYISVKNSINLERQRKNIMKFNKFYLDDYYYPQISLCY